MNDAVIYVNPYFTITPRNYTCHIMNGAQRIATKVGASNLTGCVDTTNVGAAAGTITGAASKGVSEAVKKSGVVQSIQTKMLNGVKSGTGKAAKQQANQTRKSIINFCSPGNDKQFQMKDLITYPADVVGQEVSTGVTTSGAVVDKTQEVQSNVADKLGL